MSIGKYFGVLLVLIGLLTGCGDDQKPKSQVVVNPAADSMAPRYEASLAEGVDFTKPGYPNFLVEVSGLSGFESWGRWSDGTIAKFRFKQPLPGKFTLLIKAGALGPTVGSSTGVRAGKIEKTFIVKSNEPTEYTLDFEGVDGTDTLEIVPSKPIRPNDLDPKNRDKRLLGVGFVFLKIQQ